MCIRDRFKGTSDVFLARKYGVTPIGTNAHELPMGYMGIFWDKDTEDPTYSHRQVLTDWEEEYGLDLSLFLPDTVSSDWFFKNVATPDQIRRWKGSRQDSGNSVSYTNNRIDEYLALGVNPRSKLVIFADGQDADSMIALWTMFRNRIGCTFGPGTHLTNDLGFDPVSIVVKIMISNGHSVGKLSDNIKKATGSDEAIERMKRATEYKVTFSQDCRV
jgi:nicotinate phosphoribosyltransferase